MLGLSDPIAHKEDHMIDRTQKKTETEFDEFDEIAADANEDADEDEGDESDEDRGPDVQTALTALVASTPVNFARLGITQMAYIRETVVNDLPMWGIFSAAGDPLGAAQSFDQAWAAVRQHDLQPMRVH
jgi:hypothetical protein